MNNPSGRMIVEENGIVQIRIKVVPRAARSEIIAGGGDILRVRITAPPVDGAANAEVIRLFAKKLGVSSSAVEIVSGELSRTKRLRITGVTAEAVRKLLGS